MKIKINLSKARPALNYILKGALIYLVYFLLLEIVVSGGRYERDPYLFALTLIFVIITEYLIIDKKAIKKFKTALFQGIYLFAVVVVLDFLIVNVLMLKNYLGVFSRWESIATYLIILLLPTALYFKNRKADKKYQVDELLTNHKPTL
ncbi:MAG: hypothetical protein BWY43_00069 [candidate division WS2 bacterium ADurb.Bin280]|uniref:Uncharacterized protein n=1 Tax=candidate division WS2 bacterium ADurb.Bin280 TaxID=1852829 RepID=A0A1V5SFM5_9BACT|nr:MAG: hypothetical protein BWY43_00069 [candidate division WS2 bacterium ADurb.Bin280]